VVALVAAAAIVWFLRRPTTDATAAASSSRVAASVQTLDQSVSASGTIVPKTQSNLRFGASGTVTAVTVKVGDKVTAGQQVATVDPSDLQTAVNLAQANVNAASSSITAADASSTTTSAQLTALNSQLAAAQAKLTSAQTALKGASLTTPIAGTVAAVNIAVGDSVSAGGTSSGSSGGGAGSSGSSGSSGSASSAQIIVITTDAWQVTTSVSSADLPAMKVGLQAQIVPTGTRTTAFGTVSAIGVVATTSGGVASFPVTIDVTGNPTGLYDGGTATVAIITKEVADAITVPTAAIRTENGQTVVTKVVGGVETTTPVTVGMVQGTVTQITAGLAEGDQVVVQGRTGPQSGSGATTSRARGTGGTGGFGGGTGGFGGVGNGGPPAQGVGP
jgi:multidrug efflux pump subunit AcrA (membrane-fusion protein)